MAQRWLSGRELRFLRNDCTRRIGFEEVGEYAVGMGDIYP